MVEISIVQHHFHFWDSSPIVVKEMLIFNFWGRMSAKNFFLLQFFISLGKPKFDITSFFLGHLILGESCFYSQWGVSLNVFFYFKLKKTHVLKPRKMKISISMFSNWAGFTVSFSRQISNGSNNLFPLNLLIFKQPLFQIVPNGKFESFKDKKLSSLMFNS